MRCFLFHGNHRFVRTEARLVLVSGLFNSKPPETGLHQALLKRLPSAFLVVTFYPKSIESCTILHQDRFWPASGFHVGYWDPDARFATARWSFRELPHIFLNALYLRITGKNSRVCSPVTSCLLFCRLQMKYFGTGICRK